jgi:hypothetical protein
MQSALTNTVYVSTQDIVIDAPRAGEYVAQIVGNLVGNQVVSLSFLNEAPEAFCESSLACDFVARIILSMHEKLGPERCAHMFKVCEYNAYVTVHPRTCTGIWGGLEQVREFGGRGAGCRSRATSI